MAFRYYEPKGLPRIGVNVTLRTKEGMAEKSLTSASPPVEIIVEVKPERQLQEIELSV